MKPQKFVRAGMFPSTFGSLSSTSVQTGSGAGFLSPPCAKAYNDGLRTIQESRGFLAED